MPFLALTGAPFLDAGVKLNVMSTPQVDGVAPAALRVGARLTIRFGHCCPDMVEGEITDLAFDHAVLTVGATDWILDPGPCGGGVDVPGIVSEDWIVRAAVRSAPHVARPIATPADALEPSAAQCPQPQPLAPKPA